MDFHNSISLHRAGSISTIVHDSAKLWAAFPNYAQQASDAPVMTGAVCYTLSPAWPPHPPSRTLTSSSAQWSQLMAFIWTNSLLTSVSSTCHTIVFTCLWLVIFTFVGFFDHHHVYIRKTMSFLQGPNTGCAPGYDWRHKHSCFSFLALPCLSQTPSHFSRRCSLYIFLCLLPSHSTFHYPSV